jgi:hypothetical protein
MPRALHRDRHRMWPGLLRRDTAHFVPPCSPRQRAILNLRIHCLNGRHGLGDDFR